MKPRTSLEGAFSVINVPITPAEIKVPDAVRELPNAGTESMEGKYNSRVRDVQAARAFAAPEAKPKTRQEQINDYYWNQLIAKYKK